MTTLYADFTAKCSNKNEQEERDWVLRIMKEIDLILTVNGRI